VAAYEFQAKAPDGRTVRGEVQATSETEARVKLRAQRLIPVTISPKGTSTHIRRPTKEIKSNVGAVKSKDLQVFTRQFAVLISSGVPVMQSLEAMAQGGRSPNMVAAIRGVLEHVSRGRPLAEAMGQFPNVFDRMYVNLVRAGEEGGVLDGVLNRLADYIEKSVQLRGKVTGAMWYPAIIILVAIGVISAILIFVVPNLARMFASSGQQLPALTMMVIDASNFIQEKWYLIIMAVVGAVFGFRFYYATPDGRKTIDAMLIEIPVFGGLIQKSSIARVSRTLATLLTAGVRIMDALDIAAAVAGSWVIEKSMVDAKEFVARGRTLAEPLSKVRYFPPMVTQMISIGEQTGNMDTMLSKIADFYEGEVEAATDAMTSLIEPILMVVLGGIIAVIVVAMYLPIFNLAGTVSS